MRVSGVAWLLVTTLAVLLSVWCSGPSSCGVSARLSLRDRLSLEHQHSHSHSHSHADTLTRDSATASASALLEASQSQSQRHRQLQSQIEAEAEAEAEAERQLDQTQDQLNRGYAGQNPKKPKKDKDKDKDKPKAKPKDCSKEFNLKELKNIPPDMLTEVTTYKDICQAFPEKLGEDDALKENQWINPPAAGAVTIWANKDAYKKGKKSTPKFFVNAGELWKMAASVLELLVGATGDAVVGLVGDRLNCLWKKMKTLESKCYPLENAAKGANAFYYACAVKPVNPKLTDIVLVFQKDTQKGVWKLCGMKAKRQGVGAEAGAGAGAEATPQSTDTKPATDSEPAAVESFY